MGSVIVLPLFQHDSNFDIFSTYHEKSWSVRKADFRVGDFIHCFFIIVNNIKHVNPLNFLFFGFINQLNKRKKYKAILMPTYIDSPKFIDEAVIG
jgi:hypothetical protein